MTMEKVIKKYGVEEDYKDPNTGYVYKFPKRIYDKEKDRTIVPIFKNNTLLGYAGIGGKF